MRRRHEGPHFGPLRKLLGASPATRAAARFRSNCCRSGAGSAWTSFTRCFRTPDLPGPDGICRGRVVPWGPWRQMRPFTATGSSVRITHFRQHGLQGQGNDGRIAGSGVQKDSPLALVDYFAMARPRPVPSSLVLKKGQKTLSCKSNGIPGLPPAWIAAGVDISLVRVSGKTSHRVQLFVDHLVRHFKTLKQDVE